MRVGWCAVMALLAACGGGETNADSGAGGSSSASAATGGSSSGGGAEPVSGPATAPPGGPFFLALPGLDSNYGWLVDGSGTLSRLEGIRGVQPGLIAYDQQLWITSYEVFDDGSYTAWRQRIVDGVLQEATADMFPEIVRLSFDGRYASSAAEGVRLYDFGNAEPIADLNVETLFAPTWSPSALEFTYAARTSDATHDTYFVELDDGVVGTARQLIEGQEPSDVCLWAADGRTLACRHTEVEADVVVRQRILVFDRDRDLAERAVELPGNALASTSFWFSADGRYLWFLTASTGVLSVQTVAGDEHYTVVEQENLMVTPHPTENWVGFSLPDGGVEIVRLLPAGPSRLRLDEAGRLLFGPTAQRVMVVGAQGVDEARIFLASGDDFELFFRADAGAYTFSTLDLSGALVTSEAAGTQSLVVAAGQQLQPLDLPETTLTLRGKDYLVMEELNQAERTRYYLVSWPGGAANVVTLDFDESVSLFPTGGYIQAGQP